MRTYQDEEIRDRAYVLWQEAGEPDGRDQEFWHQAERELAEAGAVDTSEEPAEKPLLPPLVGGLPIH
jgi:hypothetical protein